MSDREKAIAIREGESIGASNAYFGARFSANDTGLTRSIFDSAFTRAWDKQQSTIDALQNKIAELEKDAARLEHLFAQFGMDDFGDYYIWFGEKPTRAVIDAAMKEQVNG